MRPLYIAVLALLALPVLADDPAELQDRLKKLGAEEAQRRLALAEHCEKCKMWKEADAEYKRLVELFPDKPEIQEKAAKAAQRAEVTASRPTKADEDAWRAGSQALSRDMSKKYWELAVWASGKGLRVEAERVAEAAEKMDEALGVPSAQAKKFYDTLYPAGDERRKAVDALNGYRKKCGLPPVVFSARLSAGAQRHTEYLRTNKDHPSTAGLGAHNEDSSLPGYTPEGEVAGKSSDIGFVPPVPSMINMLGTFYHRIPLLHPDLKKVGIGWTADETKEGFGWCVIDCMSAVAPEADPKLPRVVAYPPAGMAEVQRKFDNEMPDPVPPGADRECGECVTITWFRAGKPAGGTLEVRVNGEVVEGYLSTPEKPARADFSNGTSLCFIPKFPLPAKAKVEVTAKATVDGKPFSKKWEFTTGAQEHDAWK
ncbi:MAG: CAP domain-containing protein [Planctomycetes bacterium]|nr:CAP domain-containing protein [Planctomycetota bacterium]